MPALPLSKIPLLLNTFLDTLCGAEGVPVLWQDASGSPPPLLWVRPTLKTGECTGSEKGKHGLSRRAGVFLIDIYVPQTESGAPPVLQDAYEFAEKVEKAFRREEIGGITTEDPTTTNMGVNNAGACQVRVTIPFWCWAGK